MDRTWQSIELRFEKHHHRLDRIWNRTEHSQIRSSLYAQTRVSEVTRLVIVLITELFFPFTCSFIQNQCLLTFVLFFLFIRWFTSLIWNKKTHDLQGNLEESVLVSGSLLILLNNVSLFDNQWHMEFLSFSRLKKNFMNVVLDISSILVKGSVITIESWFDVWFVAMMTELSRTPRILECPSTKDEKEDSQVTRLSWSLECECAHSNCSWLTLWPWMTFKKRSRAGTMNFNLKNYPEWNLITTHCLLFE